MLVGLKAMESTQLAPGAKVLVQLLVWENAAGLVPVILTPEILRGAVPGFCTATFRAVLDVPTFWVGKVTADEEYDKSGTRGATMNLIAFEVPPPGAGL